MHLTDLHHNIETRTAVLAEAVSADATVTGEVIDTQGFESLEFILQAGTLDDGTFQAVLVHSDEVDELGELVDETEVTADELLGTIPLVQNDLDTIDDSGVARRVGYKGGKRYTRMDVEATLPEVDPIGGTVSALAVLFTARNAPVAESA